MLYVVVAFVEPQLQPWQVGFCPRATAATQEVGPTLALDTIKKCFFLCSCVSHSMIWSPPTPLSPAFWQSSY